MSQAEGRASQIDDGEIHEWLDGELNAARAAELESLVVSSPPFAARVAEARGLIAASSRILNALDDVPGGVLPKTSSPTVIVAAAKSNSASIIASRKWSVRRWGSIAALLMVGVTGVVVARREPASNASAPVAASEAAGVNTVAKSDSSAMESVVASASARSADLLTQTNESSAIAARDSVALITPQAAIMRDRASSAPAPASRELTPPTTASAAPTTASVAPTVAPAAPTTASAAPAERASLTLAPPPAAAAKASVLGESDGPARRAAMTNRFLSGAPTSASDATGAAAVDAAIPAEIQSDVTQDDLLLSVQRVQCDPHCRQLRVEVAKDGRLRRWIQSFGSTTTADTATMSATALASLTQRVEALQLDTLPAILRLDGAKCRTVGSLRESLRVSFVHKNAPRQVMGLPWCSDGKHVLDRAAQAIESAAALQLGPVRR